MNNQVAVNEIVVRELEVEEKEAVRNLLVKSYQQYEHDYKDPQMWAEYLSDIILSVDNPHVDKILVAKNGTNIVGTLQLFQSSEAAYGRPELEIYSPIIRLLAVHPNARGLGVAQELLTASVGYAKLQGAAHLYLHTSDAMKKAIQLYEKFGFKRDLAKEFKKGEISVKCYRFDL